MEINVKLDLNNAEYSIPSKNGMVFVWYSSQDELLMFEGEFKDDPPNRRVEAENGDFLYWSDVKFWINSDVFRDKIREGME